MMLFAALLVAGLGITHPVEAMPQDIPDFVQNAIKEQFVHQLCSGETPPNVHCVREVEQCLKLLQLDQPRRSTETEIDVQRICSGSSGFSDCYGKVGTCANLFGKTLSNGQSLTTLGDRPSEDKVKMTCKMMNTPNCLDLFERCFDIIGPNANKTDFPTEEMFECSNFFDSYLKATSTSSTAQVEAICRTSEIPNCFQKVEECLKIVGPGAPIPTTPTQEIIECSELLSSVAIAEGGSADGFMGGRPGGPGFPFPVSGGNGFSMDNLAEMCQTSDIPNCLSRVEECFKLVGPDAPAPETPTKEMLECSFFLQSLLGNPDNGVQTGVSRRPIPVPEAGTGPTKEEIEVRCSSSDLPDCVQKMEECVEVLRPGALIPAKPMPDTDATFVITEKMVECSKLMQMFKDEPMDAANTTEAMTKPAMTEGKDLQSESTTMMTEKSMSDDMPQDKPGDMSQDKPEDMSQDKPGDMPQDKPGDMPQDKPGDMSQDKPEDMSQDMPQDMPQENMNMTDKPPMTENSDLATQSTTLMTEKSTTPESRSSLNTDGESTQSTTTEAIDDKLMLPPMEEIEQRCMYLEFPLCTQRVEECFKLLGGEEARTRGGRNIAQSIRMNIAINRCTDVINSYNEAANRTSKDEGNATMDGLDMLTKELNVEMQSPETIEMACDFMKVPDCSKTVATCFDLRNQTSKMTDVMHSEDKDMHKGDAMHSEDKHMHGEDVMHSEDKHMHGNQTMGSEHNHMPGNETKGSENNQTRTHENQESDMMMDEMKCSGIIDEFGQALKMSVMDIDVTKPCSSEECKACEILIRPNRSFLSAARECQNHKEQSMKECMKPVMERLLSSIGKPEIRPKLQRFFQSCYPSHDFEGIRHCVITKCSMTI